jgi:hypothetical protein
VKILALVGSNSLMLVLGVGLLPLLRLAGTRREVLARLPLAYAVGLAATGILAADLAVMGLPVGWTVLAVLAAVSAAAGLRRLPRGASRLSGTRMLFSLPAYLVLCLTAAFAIPAARLLAVIPLVSIDGWAIWGTRAHALYVFGHPIAPVFTDPIYQALQHPLLLPALEALDFRAMRTYDGALVQLQLLGFGIALVGGAWGLLRERVPALLLAATLLAMVTAPTFFHQLPTNYADIPLASFVSLGVAALAVWIRSDAPGLLPAATLFLGAGALTKNEGELFALTAFTAAAIVVPRARLGPLALGALVIVAVDLPWRIWVWTHNVTIAEYSLANLFSPSYLNDHRSRVGPSALELWRQLWRLESWSFVVPLILLGIAGALLTRRIRLALFGAMWLSLSFAGLVAIYWVSTNPISTNLSGSSDRTTDSLVLGGALLVPVLLSSIVARDQWSLRRRADAAV